MCVNFYSCTDETETVYCLYVIFVPYTADGNIFAAGYKSIGCTSAGANFCLKSYISCSSQVVRYPYGAVQVNKLHWLATGLRSVSTHVHPTPYTRTLRACALDVVFPHTLIHFWHCLAWYFIPAFWFCGMDFCHCLFISLVFGVPPSFLRLVARCRVYKFPFFVGLRESGCTAAALLPHTAFPACHSRLQNSPVTTTEASSAVTNHDKMLTLLFQIQIRFRKQREQKNPETERRK